MHDEGCSVWITESVGWHSTQGASLWRLAALRANPQHVSLPEGSAPADTLGAPMKTVAEHVGSALKAQIWPRPGFRSSM
jgi:hypothetical protein